MGEKMQAVDISKLGLAQLTQLKQQLDQEIELFSSSLQQLRAAHGKFQDSKECVEKLTPDTKGKEILVPLTGSMYVLGHFSDVDKVLCDVGTGYYVEKDISAASDYFKRKNKFVGDQITKVQKLAQDKVTLREIVIETMEAKLQATLAAQQAAGTS
ncbi:prefoldin subunit 5-like [Limulus polyphemus]|uniref:Prefoldin subunit 5-like n=1 Tax=Limulus polyphemus TaxID=6850 RepID=A0ABM1B857_LIMPO|nr:prefoldin subunit 5-like [Limulus polyphemus]